MLLGRIVAIGLKKRKEGCRNAALFLNINYKILSYKSLNLNHYIIRIRPITLPRISTWSVMMGSMASFSGCRR